MDKGFHKCVPIVMYRTDTTGKKSGYQLYSLTVHTSSGNLETLVTYEDYPDKAYVYNTLNRLYASILAILKTNRYYTSSWTEFGVKWYDILWINTYDHEIDRYAYHEEDDEE